MPGDEAAEEDGVDETDCSDAEDFLADAEAEEDEGADEGLFALPAAEDDGLAAEEDFADGDGFAEADDDGVADAFAEEEDDARAEGKAFPDEAGFGAVAFFDDPPIVFTQIGAEPARVADEPGVMVALPADGQTVFVGCQAFSFGSATFLPCTLCTGTAFMCFTGGGTALAAAGGAWASMPSTEQIATNSGTRNRYRRHARPRRERREANGLRIAGPLLGLRREEEGLLMRITWA